ncbi:MAG: 3-deoxy-manno-octulosonate cytidylyltransferase [Cyclobacteriaceae bacterium]|nr:3-deoxy-manno-octulosonate cytidylyltransferase [Cyclobacteriaceae bacterium]MDH4297410.1 3-deoxy-manno-octulosonate cytidylyltransferase [Cyclobacteriaceae bacterium]MDH5251167.1 3-deoxy-manno-octulosonate cytidylyltransferase [Cyclobacteriaceae bacterium]
MRILGIIPSRFASTRFHAKPLVDINGKSMIQRVYEQAKKSESLTDVLVATDHAEIFNHVKAFGGNACMTSESHLSGTDRCFEALTLQGEKFDYAINIQGDEPFIRPDQIDLLATKLDGKTEIATLVKAIENKEELFNPSEAKVVFNCYWEALYFSRSPIPYIRKADEPEWMTQFKYYKHVGMYAYRTDILERLTKLPVSSLEKAESLEQLRWLENGFTIAIVETLIDSFGIDTPSDLEKAIALLKN